MNTKRILFVVGIILGLVCPISAQAAATLTVTPLTWNVIGLDSNNVSVGPNNFPVGARVCNTGDAAATNVTSAFVWDTTDTYINLRPGSLSGFTGANAVASLAAGSCTDFYYEVEVTRNSAAYNHTARYHITATADTLGTVSTSTPREVFVEHLISQNRNGITDVKLNGVSIPAGGTMTLMVGNTYTIELDGFTATQGYNQLESFINFPNTIFQILSVSTTYSADSNTTNVPNPNNKLYADACIWDNDPGSPNYRSCIGGDDKAGGTVVTTYTVKILSGAGTSQTLNTLLYDFSGSSYHYNADFTTGARITSIIGPSSVTIQKTFTPKAISPGGTSVMSFKLTNPTTETFTGVNFTDTLLGGLKVGGTPGVTTSGCGTGAFSPPLAANDTSLSFSGGTLSPNSVCTITVNVTAASAGTYPNTTGHLFINTSTDTGNTGSDTLTASSASACTPGQTLANWTVPVGTTANPPDLAGGIPTIKAANVSTAAASAFIPANTVIVTTGGSNDTTAWSTWGYSGAGQYVDFVIDTSKYSGVSLSFYVKNDGIPPGPTSLVVSYNNGSGFTDILTVPNPAAAFTLHTIDFTGLTNTGGNTTFRITGSGANNNNQGAGVVYDDIKFTGCSIPAPAPTITKSFLSNPIVKGTTSSLSFTINNTAAGSQALIGVAFTDVLPAGLSVADSSTSQCGGTLTTTAATTIALTGGSLAAGGSCTFAVTVTGTTEGQYDNVSGYISSTESGTSTNYATSSLTVIAPPVLAKSFSPTSIFTLNTSTLSFTITNPNVSSSLSSIGFTDTLPAGLSVADSTSSQCGGTNNLTTTTATGTIALTGGSLAANNNCTFSVTVTGATAGTKNNTTTAVTSTEGGNGNTASGSLVVNDQTASTDLTKQVSTTGTDPWTSFIGVATSSNIFYRFKVYNSGDLQFTALSVSDPTLASTSVDPATCDWTTFLPLLPGNTATCVKGPISVPAGSHTNTATAQGTYASGTKTSSPSTATDATTGLTIAKSVTETYFTAAGNVLHYSYLVTNSGFAPLLGPVTVTDNKATVTCPAVTTVGNLSNYLDPGENITCTATYTVVAGDVTAKSVTNTASATVSGVTSPTDSKTVNLAPDLTVTKSNNVSDSVALGNTFTWTLTVSNAASAGSTSFSNTQTLLTDDLPTTGATYVLGAVTTAGGTTGTISCAIATNTLTCTASGAVTIPAGGSFSVPITVTPTAAGSLVNPRSGGTCAVDPSTVIPEIDETNNNCTPNTVTVTATAPTAADLAITKTDGASSVNAGGSTTYTITVTNNGPSEVTGATVVDTAPAGLTIGNWTCAVTTAGSGGTVTTACGAASGSGNINTTVTMKNGAVITYTVPATVAGSATGTIANTATVTVPSGVSDPTSDNNSATDSDTVNAPSEIPTLSEWGMILVALFLALEGARSLRTRINH